MKDAEPQPFCFVMQRYAPVSFYLDEVNREPLTEPKQDRPTNTGMIHAITPRCLLPKSWGGGEAKSTGVRFT